MSDIEALQGGLVSDIEAAATLDAYARAPETPTPGRTPAEHP